MGGARRRPRKSLENSRKSNCGVYLRLCSNSFYQKFLKITSASAAAAIPFPQTPFLRRSRPLSHSPALRAGSFIHSKVRRRRTKFVIESRKKIFYSKNLKVESIWLRTPRIIKPIKTIAIKMIIITVKLGPPF